MKTIFGMMVLFAGVSSQAGTCNLVSGYFKTTTTECRYSHDGVNFFNEGHKDIKIAYTEKTDSLNVLMNVSGSSYSLNYTVDGKVQNGRPMYEGEKYTASCENNHIHVRAEMSAFKHPLIHDYTITDEGKMIYEESFEGSSFVRICEMDRN